MSVTNLADDHPKARTQHRCQMCNRIIQPGEVYRRQRNIGDDGPYVWKECAHCEALFRVGTFDDYWWEEGIGWETFADWDPSTITELRWKVQWRRQWTRRDGYLYPIPGDAA